MANSGETQPHRKRGAVLLTFLFLVSVTSMGVQAADSDGDGVQDSADDCPWSAGTSTVDKDGCPDRDGDGTSLRTTALQTILATQPGIFHAAA